MISSCIIFFVIFWLVCLACCTLWELGPNSLNFGCQTSKSVISEHLAKWVPHFAHDCRFTFQAAQKSQPRTKFSRYRNNLLGNRRSLIHNRGNTTRRDCCLFALLTEQLEGLQRRRPRATNRLQVGQEVCACLSTGRESWTIVGS